MGYTMKICIITFDHYTRSVLLALLVDFFVDLCKFTGKRNYAHRHRVRSGPDSHSGFRTIRCLSNLSHESQTSTARYRHTPGEFIQRDHLKTHWQETCTLLCRRGIRLHQFFFFVFVLRRTRHPPPQHTHKR